MNVDRCARWRALGSRALDRELGELDTARLERHLVECAACSVWLAEVRGFTGLLRAAELERPEQEFQLHRLHRARLRASAAAATAASIAAAAAVALTLQVPTGANPGASSAGRVNEVSSSPVLMWRSGHGALSTALAVGVSRSATPQHVVNRNVAS